MSHVAEISRLAGTEGSFSTAPSLVSTAEFSDYKKTTFDYIKVLGVRETLGLLLLAIWSV